MQKNETHNKSYLYGEVCYTNRRTTSYGDVINCKVKAVDSYTKDGQAYERTYYGRCVIWQSNDYSLEGIEDGAIVEVSGYLHNNKYNGTDGTERSYTEMVVRRLRLVAPAPLPEIKPETKLSPEVAAIGITKPDIFAGGEDIAF